MIHFISGVFVDTIENGVVIEAGGLGYEVFVPDNSAVYTFRKNESVKLYTYMAVREDDVSLYGFTDTESMKLFKLLITVNGIGAKAAMALLSSMPTSELKNAIAFEDAALLTKANGIGKKTAQRIVLELKEKVGKEPSLERDTALPGNTEGMALDGKTDALNGLMALGYSRSEAINALSAVSETGLSSEQYIKLALKKLF